VFHRVCRYLLHVETVLELSVLVFFARIICVKKVVLVVKSLLWMYSAVIYVTSRLLHVCDSELRMYLRLSVLAKVYSVLKSKSRVLYIQHISVLQAHTSVFQRRVVDLLMAVLRADRVKIWGLITKNLKIILRCDNNLR